MTPSDIRTHCLALSRKRAPSAQTLATIPESTVYGAQNADCLHPSRQFGPDLNLLRLEVAAEFEFVLVRAGAKHPGGDASRNDDQQNCNQGRTLHSVIFAG